MKTYSFLLFFLLLFGISAQGQIKIGDNPQNIAPGSVLELESSTRVLVITRISTPQMNAIIPLQGALIYNTDSNCIHYYNGTQWLNLCDALTNSGNISLVDNGDGTYTFTNADQNTTIILNTTNTSFLLENGNLVLTDSNNSSLTVALDSLNINTFSSDSTITITKTNNNYDFKVAEINGTHIKDRSITREDISSTAINGGFHIQNRSITAIKMQAGLLNDVLQTQIAGNPPQPTAVWAPLNSNNILGQNLEVGDSSITIEGGTGATLLTARVRVSDNGITTEKIGTQGIIDANKILGTDANGDPEWQEAATTAASLGEDIISSDGSISGVMNNSALVGMDLQVNVDGTTIEIDPTNGLQIRDDAITSEKIADFQVGTPHIAFNSVNSDILLDGHVTLSKLADGGPAGQLMRWDGNEWLLVGESDLIVTETDGIIGNEITGATNSTLIRSGDGDNISPYTLAVNTDGITSNEILDNTITDIDISPSAAIQGTKIAPDFGTLAVVTTGTLTSGNATVNGTLEIVGQTTINSGLNATTLPMDRGAPDQVLTTDGTGAANWQSLPVDNNTTYTPGEALALSVDNEFSVANDQITSEKITNGTIEDIDISPSAAIQGTKIDPNFGAFPVSTTGSLTSGNTSVTGSLDITGQTTINNGPASTSLPTDRGAPDQVLTTDGAGAANWQSLPVDNNTTYTPGEALTLVGTVFSVADDQITSEKITDSTIEDIDISSLAAIQGTKIDPDFGAFPVSTTGTLTSGNTSVTGSLDISGQTTINNGPTSTTLPTDRGIANQVLTTDGAGTATWASPTTTITGTSGSIFFASDDGSGTGPPIENNSEIFWDSTNNRLGVGTSSPTHKLQVVGAIRGSAILNANGTPNLPSYRFEDDLNTGMYRSAGSIGWLRFATDGTEAITIDPNQRVGIGTPTPNSTLHTGGSFSTNIRSDNSLAVIITDSDHTVIVGDAVTTIFLPAPSTDNTGRIYIIKNISAIDIPITDYLDSNGNNETNVSPGVTQLQSDGVNWQQIN
ncbi:hypothetical protein HCG49_17835 [Arenibacter sp. 6A1]|uniref:beta strand repeat-containing protein n=1 Tax=Arenibacter sp. 6A1 TaxID=2720391 RepID=UPI001444F766|nr:hypothetical protein [Arenibacter sp. 6A1]NKI28415.1 hypothetical protein [Arenibacter sp. 6A1]